MIKNYFFLNRFIVEANIFLKDYKIISIFSQEKDTLLFELNKNDEYKFLEISVNPGFPFINVRDSFHRAKKNVIDFYQNYIPSPLLGFEISNNDRVIKIILESGNIYFAVRGKYTNIYFIDKNNKIDSFKKGEEEVEHNFLKEINNTYFIDYFNKIDFGDEEIDLDNIKKKYPIIGKEIINESKVRLIEKSSPKKILTKIIEEIIDKKSALFYDEKNFEISLAVETFSIYPFTQKFLFNNLIEAVNSYLIKKYSLSNLEKKHKLIDKFISKELSRLSAKVNNLKTRIENGSKEEIYNKIGNLLLINLSSIKKGMKEIIVEDIYNDSIQLKVKLNETLSPKKNVDYYFDKSKSERINFEKSKELYKNISGEYFRIKKYEEKLVNAKIKNDYDILIKELKLKREEASSPADEIKNKFKQYLIEGKYKLFVGKDSQNNDLLTTKFAKQNDYWFHARSVPGSHIVLKVENTKEAVPKNILKKAASLAAYHSKAKTSGMAPVSYTLKKYVIKKKGMEPGKVALLKEEVLIVKPEIPDGCEYVFSE